MRTRLVVAPVLLLILLVFDSAIAAQIQVIHIRDTAIPAHVIVQKGALIEFSGDLPDGDAVLPTTFIVRCNNMVRASGKFTKKWLLQFDPSKEPLSRFYITLYRAEESQPEVRVARVGVTVLDGVPFRLAAPADHTATDASVSVQVATSGALRIAGGEILVDGSGFGAKLDAKGAGTISLIGLKPGVHLLTAKVAADGGGDFETEGVHITLSPTIRLTRTEVGPVDLRHATPRIPVRLILPAGLQLKAADYFLDGKPFARNDAPPFDSADLNAEGLPTGMHTLSAEVTLADGQKHVAPDLPLQVIGNAKGEFAVWQARLQKLLDRGTSARAAFNEAADGFGQNRATIGDLHEALKKLRATDLDIEYALQKITPPSSLAAGDADTLIVALGECRTAYSHLVHVDETGLRAVESNSTAATLGYLLSLRDVFSVESDETRIRLLTAMRDQIGVSSVEINQAINSALLKVATANERINAVANKLESAETQQRFASAFSYPVTGNAQQDFITWSNTLDGLITGADTVREQYQEDQASAANILALDKAINLDVQMEYSIGKLLPPKALNAAQRQDLTLALQSVGAAYGYRAQAEKILRKRMAAYLGVAANQGAFSDAVSPELDDQVRLFNKAQSTLSAARERVKAVARQLGAGP